MLNRNYPVFLLSLGIFVIILIYSFVTYVRWDAPIDGDVEILEVNLPIIDWQDYSALSKQPGNGKIK